MNVFNAESFKHSVHKSKRFSFETRYIANVNQLLIFGSSLFEKKPVIPVVRDVKYYR